jgi:hypothetical protein
MMAKNFGRFRHLKELVSIRSRLEGISYKSRGFLFQKFCRHRRFDQIQIMDHQLISLSAAEIQARTIQITLI